MAFVSYEEELAQIWHDNLRDTKSRVLVDGENLDYSILLCIKNQHSCNGAIVTRKGKKYDCLCGCHHVPETNGSSALWDPEKAS
jgi:hypothetical protein